MHNFLHYTPSQLGDVRKWLHLMNVLGIYIIYGFDGEYQSQQRRRRSSNSSSRKCVLLWVRWRLDRGRTALRISVTYVPAPPAQTNTSVFADHIHSYLIVRTPVLVDLLTNIHCRNQMGGHILPSGQSSCVTLFRPIAMHALRVKIRLLVRGQTGLLLLGAF